MIRVTRTAVVVGIVVALGDSSARARCSTNRDTLVSSKLES